MAEINNACIRLTSPFLKSTTQVQASFEGNNRES
jgi:hypothetical protein